MRDLKIKPGMDTPKAKLKNPAPKDADSLLKQHMDKRQREKEPESHDPVRYATDRVEKNMRRGASGAADASRRMIKHYANMLMSIILSWSRSFSMLGNWIMNIPMMCFCNFCVGCKVADRELLSQKHEITSQRVK